MDKRQVQKEMQLESLEHNQMNRSEARINLPLGKCFLAPVREHPEKTKLVITYHPSQSPL